MAGVAVFLSILHIVPLAFHTESFQQGIRKRKGAVREDQCVCLLACLFSLGILPTAMYYSLWKSFSYGNADFQIECKLQYQAHQFLKFVPPPFNHLQMGKQNGVED